MYSFNPFSIISLISANIYLLMVLYILMRNPKALTNWLFTFVGITMFVWGAGEGLERASVDYHTALNWAVYVVGLGSALHPAFLLHFWLVFSGKIKNYKNPLALLIYLPAVILLIIRFINPAILITGLSREYWGYSTNGTPLYLVYMLYIALSVFLVAFLALKTARESEGDLKTQARQIGIGIIISLLLGLMTQVSRPLLHLPLPELSVTSTIIFLSFIAYAINKSGLLVITTKLVAENIIATMDDYLLAFDSKFNLALIDKSASRKLGISEQEALGKPIKQFISSNLIDLPYMELISKFPIVGDQAYLISKTSDRIPVSVNASVIKAQANKNSGFVFVLRDMSKINELVASLSKQTTQLENAKSQVELEVKQRTQQLESLKNNLEQLVNQRTEELKKAMLNSEKNLSLLTATLDATSDGLLVVDSKNRVESYNKKFVDLWKIPTVLIETNDDNKLLDFMVNEIENPDEFRRKVNELYAHPDRSSVDMIRFKDGKICERNSQPQIIGQNIAGRVWSFRDATSEYKSNEELKKHTQELEQMNQMMVDRELYMVEQKKKIAELEAKLKDSITASA